MNKRLFNELVESIKEAGRIHRGEIKASREFVSSRKTCAPFERGFISHNRNSLA